MLAVQKFLRQLSPRELLDLKASTLRGGFEFDQALIKIGSIRLGETLLVSDSDIDTCSWMRTTELVTVKYTTIIRSVCSACGLLFEVTSISLYFLYLFLTRVQLSIIISFDR